MAQVIRHKNHLAKEIQKSPRKRRSAMGLGVLFAVIVLTFVSHGWFKRTPFSYQFYEVFVPIWIAYMLVSVLRGGRTNTAILKRGLEGEQRTERILSHLPDHYTVISDLTIHADGKESQIDHVVVGPTGVFVIETKNLNGIIEGKEEDREFYQHKVGRAGGEYGKPFYNPTKQVGTHVWRVSQFLKEHRIHTWVYGAVFFSNPAARVHVVATKTPVFSYQEGPNRMLDYIVHRDGESLSKEQQQRIVHLVASTIP